eukprot:5580509-Pyramimonas_sp.AAC.2
MMRERRSNRTESNRNDPSLLPPGRGAGPLPADFVGAASAARQQGGAPRPEAGEPAAQGERRGAEHQA